MDLKAWAPNGRKPIVVGLVALLLAGGGAVSFIATHEDGSQTSKRSPNRLIHEKSPYLLQHAYNPVDWHPWGEETFAKARKENKPIFLSIGYSTCYWCHVMEREVFEKEELAGLMNRHFVSIKVDCSTLSTKPGCPHGAAFVNTIDHTIALVLDLPDILAASLRHDPALSQRFMRAPTAACRC